jgi:hypothetical protein
VFEDPNTNLPPQWRLFNNTCDYQACWVAAVSAVSYMLLEEGLTPQFVYEVAKEHFDPACNVPLAWQDIPKLAEDPQIGFRTEKQATSTTYSEFYSEVRTRLVANQRAIALIGVCGTTDVCGGWQEPGSRLGQLQAYSKGHGHFVVITGVSRIPGEPNGWDLARINDPQEQKWHWVRLYDPFKNGVEYHLATQFKDWLAGSLQWLMK